MTERLHPELETEIRRLARSGVPAAEIRRRLVATAERVRVPRPGYTTVQQLVQAERQSPQFERWEPTASPLDSLVSGRMPTPYELGQVRERRLRRRLVN